MTDPWHVQFWDARYDSWQTMITYTEMMPAVNYLLSALRTWDHCLWRLHNYGLEETIPGDIFHPEESESEEQLRVMIP